MLYLESPAGVGYSYAEDGVTATDDIQVDPQSYSECKHYHIIYAGYRSLYRII